MKKNRFYIVASLVLLLAFAAIGIVQAGGYDLSIIGNTATINGAIFEAFNPADPTGSGNFNAFVRVSSNQPIEQGYNTDYRPLQFDENSSPTFTHSSLLSEVPQVVITTTNLLYREFQLDINQLGSAPFLTLDNFELFESPYPALCGYPFDGSGGGHAGCTTNNTATKVYGMDEGTNNFLVLDYNNNTGSGKRDMKVSVPNAVFNADPNCNYGGVGCTVYVNLYMKFGQDSDPGDPNPLLKVAHGNNDGFEEWGVRVVEPTAITLNEISTGSGDSIVLPLAAAFGLLAVATFVVLRRARATGRAA